MEIPQSVAMERQAFEALLNLHNGLEHLDLEGVEVDLRMYDLAGQPIAWTTDPDDTTALFFVTQTQFPGLASPGGGAIVPAGSTTEARWLLIPAPGAGGDGPGGLCYEVGARLRYTLAGTRYDLDLAPDAIQVLPLPELRVDLFVPEWVSGDDPRTPAVELSRPTAVGLRVLNTGAGGAAQVVLSLDPPRIVDNVTGLALDVALSGCDVDGRAAPASLLAALGDLAPVSASVVRWWMTCSLAGTFVDVGVRAVHADELGGAVTALIRDGAVRAHRLRKDVRVERPGSDDRVDFLAVDGRVYESDGTDALCADVSASATMVADGAGGTVSVVSTGGFVYAGVRLPGEAWPAGRVSVRSAVRADGLRLASENVWTEMRRSAPGDWESWLGLFDSPPPGTATYRVELRTDTPNRAPGFEPVAETRGVTGRELTIRIDAYDPDGTVPRVSVADLPVGARYQADGPDGGWVRWTPADEQAGSYRFTCFATDGELTGSVWIPVAIAVPGRERGTLFLFR